MTLAGVAAEAGVSVSAVSKVLLGGGGQTTKVGAVSAARIRESARRLGYFPNVAARQLRTGRSRIVGAIIHTQAPQVHYVRFAKIQQRLAALGYGFMIGQCEGDADAIMRYLRDFRSRQADVIVSDQYEMPGQDQRLREVYSAFENVLFLGQPRFQRAACVRSDTAAGIASLVAHLARQGIRRLALDVLDKYYTPVRLRIAGYREGLKAAGMAPDNDLLIESAGPIDDVSELLNGALRLKAEAVIASNDLRALMLVKALHGHGLHVPRDMRVTGFDNMAFSPYTSPALTTIDTRDDQIADAVVAMIRHYLEHRRFPENRVVAPELVVRETA